LANALIDLVLRIPTTDQASIGKRGEFVKNVEKIYAQLGILDMLREREEIKYVIDMVNLRYETITMNITANTHTLLQFGVSEMRRRQSLTTPLNQLVQ